MFKIIARKDFGSTIDVNYFGILLTVPKWTRYIATDKSGGIYATASFPIIDHVLEEWNCMSYQQVGFVSYDGEWKESLMEVK